MSTLQSTIVCHGTEGKKAQRLKKHILVLSFHSSYEKQSGQEILRKALNKFL